MYLLRACFTEMFSQM